MKRNLLLACAILGPALVGANPSPSHFKIFNHWEQYPEWERAGARRVHEISMHRTENGPSLVTHRVTKTHARPYFHPLRSPDGKGVLTEFAPNHHKHQTGLYWGPTRINGRDYFHHYDQKSWTSSSLFDAVCGTPVRVSSNAWMTGSVLADENAKLIMAETQMWTLINHEEFYTLDLAWTGTALVDLTFGKYNYGGLFLRMPWKKGTLAKLINSEGLTNQAGEGKSARWIDLGMAIKGLDGMGHIAIIDHPKNPGYPTLWRIDGQFGVGPAFTRRGDIVVAKGKRAHYQYRVIVYQGEHNRALVEQEAKKFGGTPWEKAPPWSNPSQPPPGTRDP